MKSNDNQIKGGGLVRGAAQEPQVH